jgi:hypothetical protein
VEIEDYVAGFLGVHIERNIYVTIHLTQRIDLINRITKALNLQADQLTKSTPSEQGCFGANIDGEPVEGSYN